MTAPDGKNLIFDWDLLEDAKRVLDGKPELSALNAADGMSAESAAFGTADGGAAAAARLNDWLIQAQRDLAAVSSEVASLATAAGEAARTARGFDQTSQAIAQGNEAMAKPLEAPAPRLGGG